MALIGCAPTEKAPADEGDTGVTDTAVPTTTTPTTPTTTGTTPTTTPLNCPVFFPEYADCTSEDVITTGGYIPAYVSRRQVFDACGQVQTEQHMVGPVMALVYNYSYTSWGELELVEADSYPNLDGITDFEFRNVFDANQRMTRFETNYEFMAGPNAWCGADFSYIDPDDLYDEAVWDCDPWGTEYFTWSPSGVMLTADMDWDSDGGINESLLWTIDALDQVVQFDIVSDNPLSGSTLTFTWENGLKTSSTSDLGSDGDIEVYSTYAYDAEERLIEAVSIWPDAAVNNEIVATTWICPVAPPPAQRRTPRAMSVLQRAAASAVP